MKSIILFALCVALMQLAFSQDRVEIGQTIRDLSSPGVVMNVSAHPDDEDGATLAYYRMKHGVHTYSVLFTRGEGGQNEKGSELYEDLGVIRSAETRAAGAILGAEVEFLNFPDFGYSKTATEAFHMWGGKPELLRRLVYVIRKIKPDVIFSNHNTWGGHGHHQAVAITAIEAFDAAADSAMFPDQLREPGITVWQPKKLFLRVFAPGQGQIGADVTHNLEEVNDLRGVAYIDVATTALRKHRTQGLDRADLRAFSRGRSAYRLARASSLFSTDSTDFFSGIWTWDHEPLRALIPLRVKLLDLRAQEPPDSLVASASLLLPLVGSALHTDSGRTPLGSRILARWAERLEHLASVAAGVECSPMYADSILVPGQKLSVVFHSKASRGALRLQRVAWVLPDGWSAKVDSPAIRDNSSTSTLQVGEHPRLTYPRAEYLYRPIEDGNPAEGLVDYSIDGHPLTVRSLLPVDVAPPHLIRVTSESIWAQPEDLSRGITLECTVTNMFPHQSAGTVMVSVPSGWHGTGFSFALEHEGMSEKGSVRFTAPATVADGDYKVRLSTGYAEREVTLRVAHIEIPQRLRVGLVSSYDTTLVTSLVAVGIACDTLSDAMLTGGDLGRYRTILVDMRAYLVRDALKQQNARLLEYVRGGGNLVVMYQREGEWKPAYAPYPFSVSRQRVTMEDAPITILAPDHPLFNWPNRISPVDWNGWKQERSVYLPVNVPSEYLRLMTAHDPDEPDGDTGYLVAPYGKGSYIYTTYVWYRQTKDRHPGALRCLVNMMAYPLRPH